MAFRYKLVGHEVVEEPDLLSWALWFESANREVALTEIEGVVVSTVFLGLDPTYGKGQPKLFETEVFNGVNNHYQRRYFTWDEAQAGHNEVVEAIRSGQEL